MKIRNSLFENSQYLETIVKIHKSDQLGVMDAYRINRLVKKLDEIPAKVAAPPKAFFKIFVGVLIVSSAVDPKTVSILPCL